VLSGPFQDAALSKLPLLVADEHRAFDQRAFGDHVGIIYLKPHHFQLVLDVARENELESIEVFGKELKPIAMIYIARDFLAQVRHVTDPALPLSETGAGYAVPLRRGDDRRTIMKGDVVQLEGNVLAFQDAPDRDA